MGTNDHSQNLEGSGLGDIQHKSGDPLESYFDILRAGVKFPRRKWIVKPEFNPLEECKIPGMEGIQKLIECHGLPRLWQLMSDLWVRFQCGTYFVKGPNWIEPPITARVFDIRNEVCVTIPTGVVSGSPGVETTVVTGTITDRWVGSLLGFGHAVVNPAQWGDLLWSIKVNEAPIPGYHNFRQQIGEFVDPTLFPAPYKLKHEDIVTVTVINSGALDACVYARLYGFIFPAKMVTQDGSFADYHVL
jgi:hypothetical protein